MFRVRALKSLTGYFSFEGSLAWSPDGKRIAAIEKNGLGQRWLILLDIREARAKVDVREPLPIAGPIARVDFSSNSHIRVEGETQVFDQDIPVSGKLADGAPYKLSPALPKKLKHGEYVYRVYGWVCI